MDRFENNTTGKREGDQEKQISAAQTAGVQAQVLQILGQLLHVYRHTSDLLFNTAGPPPSPAPEGRSHRRRWAGNRGFPA